MPVVLTSPVGGLTVSDLGVPLVSSFIGAVAGTVIPNMADIRQPGFNFLGLSAGDWVAIIAFLGALGIASYARDPTVKTVAVLAGSIAVVARAVLRVAQVLARPTSTVSAVHAAPVAPVKKMEFTADFPPPPEPHPIMLATPTPPPAAISQVTLASQVAASDIALLHR